MNIVRTTAVELAGAPAIAYRQKLKSGGAGLKIIHLETGASAAFTVAKRTGDAVAYGAQADESVFTKKLIAEAVEATLGLPYAMRGAVAAVGKEESEPVGQDAVAETDLASAKETQEPEKINIYATDEYKTFMREYTDANGKFSYQRLNKSFIQFAAKSKMVEKMLSDKAGSEEMLVLIVQNRAAFLAGKTEPLSLCETKALIAAVDEINPRSAFKELTAHLRKMAGNKS
jgi:HJR/Mrr/RecB family endonuclease